MKMPKACTPQQQKQFTRFVEDAAVRALTVTGLDKEGVQSLLMNGGEFQAEIEAHVTAVARRLSLCNQYASEEVESTCTYPEEYTGPKKIGDQVEILANAFGFDAERSFDFIFNTLPNLELPSGAEGWFAIPSVDALAKRHFPSITDPAEQYCCAVDLMVQKIEDERDIVNHRKGQIRAAYFRQHPRTVSALRKISETQKGDIIVVPAQFGMRYRGRSARRAREVFLFNEFGLGALAVGSMILAHPERLVCWEQLHLECPGDEYDYGGGRWADLFFFNWVQDRITMHTAWSVDANQNYGSVTGFIPA